MLERINLILKSRNVNAAQFADEIGVQRSSVSHILTGRNNASLDFLLKVLTRYPEIDTDWLLTGKGVMMRSAATMAPIRTEAKKSEPINMPLVSTPNESSGDLFKPSIEHQEFKKEIPNVEENVSSRIITPENNLASEVGAQKKPDERVSKTTSARLIEKIVIFYSDKSFAEYKPED
jgi:transcriptional regulator with XRE-family HTH domain